MVNPPVVNPQLGIRRSYVAETRRLAVEFLRVVGFGCFEGSRFHVWQFVLPSFAGERRLLAAVTAAVSRAHTVVTFNGKSFDLPFMEMRWLYHRLATPFPALRHLDLLHPARRLWGPDTGGLGAL